MDFLVNIVILLAIIVPLVLAHELGHFVMARRAGVTVHEFGIGFPPRALILHRGKETIYSLNWLPIGGFVRLEGEEGESLDPRAFVNQKLGTRLRILIAGVVVNFAHRLAHLHAHRALRRAGLGRSASTRSCPTRRRRAGLVASRVIGETEPIELVDADGQPTGETRRCPSTTTRATCWWPSMAAASRSSTTSPTTRRTRAAVHCATWRRVPERPSC